MNGFIQTPLFKIIASNTLKPDAIDLIKDVMPQLKLIHNNDKEIEEVLSFCINFLNSENLKGLLFAQQPVRIVIEQILIEEDAEKIDVIRKIIDAFAKSFSDFNVKEFTGKYAIKQLSDSLINSKILNENDNSETVEGLNSLLSRADLYDKLIETKKSLPSENIVKLKKLKKIYHKTNKEADLRRLNRIALEEFYPRETPKQDQYKPELRERPLKPENPLLYFHLSCLNYDAYPILSASFHYGLRLLEEELNNKVDRGVPSKIQVNQKLQDYVIPCGHAIRFYERDEGEGIVMKITEFEKEKIRRALNRGLNVQYKSPDVLKNYIADVLYVLSNPKPPRRIKKFTTTSWGRIIIHGKKGAQEIVDVRSAIDEYGISLPIKTHIIFDSVTKEEATEGAYPLEEAEAVIGDNENDLARILASLQIRPALFPSFWSRNNIPLNLYSFLYREAIDNVPIENMTEKQLAYLLFLMTLILFGFNPEQVAKICLRSLSVSDTELNDKTIYCEPEGGYFFYRMPDDQISKISFIDEDKKQSELYREAQNIIIVPTGVIATLLKNFIGIRKKDSLFIYKDDHGNPHGLSLKEFGRWLHSKKNDEYGSISSLYAFPRSFYNYATNRYDMDPLVAAYISARVPRELRAPVFYTNLGAERLSEAVVSFQTSLLSDIKTNAESLAGPLTDNDLMKSDHDISAFPKSSFGSNYVPLIEPLKKLLKSLKENLLGDKFKDPILRYNLYIFYNNLIWMLACGLRQVEVARMKDVYIDVDKRLLLVEGKGNRLYEESRLIFCSPLVIKSFLEIKEYRRHIKEKIISRGKFTPEKFEIEKVNNNTFFYIGPTDLLRPASSVYVRAFLKDSAINYPFKLNATRHLLRSHLFDRKVPYKYLAAFLGHQTKGKEFLSLYSLGFLNDMEAKIGPYVNNLMADLELDVISYERVVKS